MRTSRIPVLLRFVGSLALTCALAAQSTRAQSITPYCFGTFDACPCGNAAAPDAGCMNSFGVGGKLVVTGDPLVSADTILFTVSNLPTTALAQVWQSTHQANSGFGTVFGDGLRCGFRNLIRLGNRTASAGGFAFGYGVVPSPKISVKGLIPDHGGARFYQVYYRNSASFCSPDTFNLTNGVKVVWAP